jgi:hypothetical protein
MRQTTTVEVRLDHGKAASFGAARPTRPPFGAVTRSAASKFWNFVAARLPGTEDQVRQTRNPENVGLGVCRLK